MKAVWEAVPSRWHWVVPCASAVLLYACAYAACAVLFNVAIVPRRVPADLAAFTAISLLVFAVSRHLMPFLILQSLLAATLYVGSAAKGAITGRPLMPDDIYNLGAFVRLMGPAGWLLAVLPCLLIVGLFLGNLRFTGRLRRAAFSALVVFPVGADAGSPALVGWMDAVWGDKPWDQGENFVWRGGTVHMLQELLRISATSRPAPDAAKVADAIAARAAAAGAPRPAAGKPGRLRNIHLVLEESFWDPSPLKAAGVRGSALDPRFLALWDEAGRSTALSPAFGGQTANAEFEVLCGFPLAQAAVRFEQPMGDPLPCLPRILAAAGYRAVASHPNEPGFWNRQAVYGRIGFETFWSVDDFKLDDMTSVFLSDASLHRQVAAKISASDDGRPVFDYTVTYYGHWLYDLDKNRPKVVETTTGVEELARYLSVVHWKSRDMVGAITRWRREDPDAIIVIFGDHLPLLGKNLAGYAESGFLDGGEMTAASALRSSTTPLIVIDGRNGPVRAGTVPMYRLGALILDLAGLSGAGGITRLSAPPSGLTLRPLPGVVAGTDGDGQAFLCRGGDAVPPCDAVAPWQSDVDTLARDIFNGDGHALSASR